MSHELLRLSSKLTNVPLLASSLLVGHVFDYMKREGRPDAALAPTERYGERRLSISQDGTYGYLPIDGPITAVAVNSLSAGESVSHQGIRESAEQLVAAGVKVIVLDQDSGGGEAYGTFETASYIRNLCDDNDVKLLAYVDGISASASYAYTAVAHEAIANKAASVGSIGVVIQLFNNSKALKDKGIERSFVFAGKNKIPFDPDGGFTEDFMASLQKDVDEVYEDFVEHVAMWRGLTSSAVVDTEAKMFKAKEALTSGLVDKVMDKAELENYLSELTQNSDENMPLEMKQNPKVKESMKETETLAASVSTLTQELELKAGTILDLEGELTNLKEQVAELLSSNEAAMLEAKEAREALDKIEGEALTLKLNTRVESLVKVLGDVSGPEVATQLESLSDEAFALVLKGYEVADQKLEATFAEQGTSNSHQAPETEATSEEESLEHKRLTEKYNKEGAK